MRLAERRWSSCLAALVLTVSLLLSACPAGRAASIETTEALPASKEEIRIRTAEEFLAFAQSCSFDAWSRDKTVYLEHDIALDGTAFQPIATFGGVFDGQGHTISGLTLDGSFAPIGLFRVLQEQGTIQNLHLSATVAPTGDGENTGGLVGENHGKILHCSVTGSISGKVNTGGIAGINMQTGSIQSCTSGGQITGSSRTGGIVGCNNGRISECTNAAYVNNESSDAVLDPSDIDLDFSLDMQNLTSPEALTSVCDSGGIAGYSSGQILSSKNTGVVGYPHFGYNAGGIAGRSCGYIFRCENSGYICGRKDVGGVAGQLEPEVEMILSEDYLTTLSGQFENLSVLVDRAGSHASGAGASVQSHLGDLQGYLGAAQSAVISLRPDSIDDVLDGPNREALDALRQAVGGMEGCARDIGSTVGSSAATLGNDAGSITDQISAIADTLSLASEELKKEPVTDTSLEQLEDIRQGKALLCRNSGSVYGDVNTGGIAGCMSVEAGLDPEDDLSIEVPTSQRKRYQLKTIIQSCTNTGKVTGKHSYVGSICGRMDLGLITNSEGYGQIESESGNYVGGIAGQTCATVQSCFSKCILSGGDYVGGIVGNGLEEAANGSFSRVADCYSMVEIDRYAQYAGAVSGGDAGSFAGNFFVSGTLAGIDHTSYEGMAQPLSYTEFMALEAPASAGDQVSPGFSLPNAFKTLSVRFVADDTVIQTQTVPYGGAIPAEDYPEIPPKDGCSARWDQEELDDLQFDTVVTVQYTQYVTALPSFEKRENGRSVFFVSGRFAPGDAITVTAQPASPATFPQIPNDTWEGIVRCFTGTVLYREVLEQWHIEIPDDGTERHIIRYLPCRETSDHLAIFVKQAEGWVPVDGEAVGSYLSFPCNGTSVEIAVISYRHIWWVWLLTIVVLAAFPGLLRLAVGKFRKPKKPATVIGDEECVHCMTQNPPKKRRWIFLCLPAVLLLMAGVGIWAFLQSDVKTGLDAWQLVSQLRSREQFAAALSVTAGAGDSESNFQVHIEKTTDDGSCIAVIGQEPLELYCSGGVVYLENGKAFQIRSDHTDLTEYAAGIFRSAKITETDGIYTVTVPGSDAMAMLSTLISSQADKISAVHTLTLSLAAQNGLLSGVTCSSEGTLTEEETPYKLEATLTVLPPDPELAIPDAVRAAISDDTDAPIPLSDQLIALGKGWMDLNSRSLIAADITLSADCGPLVICEDVTIHRQRDKDTTIGCLQKDDYAIYFTDQKLCTGSGTSLSLEQQPLVESAKLLDIACELCMNADCSFQDDCYTVALGEKEMESVVQIIAPEAADLPIHLTNGVLNVYMSNGAISRITISCSGSMEILVAEVEVSVSANIQIREPDEAFSIPQRVYSALG